MKRAVLKEAVSKLISDSFGKGRTMPRWPVHLYDDEEAGIRTANLHAETQRKAVILEKLLETRQDLIIGQTNESKPPG